MKRKLKRISIDIAGYALILLGLLTGWLPGPGGIPLILAGLGLLSINNQWAKNIMHYLKENSQRLLEITFQKNKFIEALHDLFVLILIAVVVFNLSNDISYINIGISIAAGALAIVDFLYNRERGKRIKILLKK